MTFQAIIEFIIFLVIPVVIAGFYFPQKLVDWNRGEKVSRKQVVFWGGLIVLILIGGFVFPIVNLLFPSLPRIALKLELRIVPLIITGLIIFTNLTVRQIIYRLRLKHEKIVLDLGKIDKALILGNIALLLFSGATLIFSWVNNTESVSLIVLTVAFYLIAITNWLLTYFSNILIIEDGIATSLVTMKWNTIKHVEWGKPNDEKISLTIKGGRETKVNIPVNQQAKVKAILQSHHVKEQTPPRHLKPAWLKEPSADWVEYQQKKKAILDSRPKVPIAQFPQRVAAFVIDGAIILIPLFYLFYIFDGWAFALGPYGRFIFYAIILGYISYYNSHHKKGQTIGQRLMHIAVVDRNYNFLSLGKSLFRTSIICLIFVLFRWELPQLNTPVLSTFAGSMLTGGILALAYGTLANMDTRQGIHDLLVESYVVKWPPITEAPLPPPPKRHQAITFSLFVIGFLLFNLASAVFPTQDIRFGVIGSGDFQELETTLSQDKDIISAKVVELLTTRNEEQLPRGDLEVYIWARPDCNKPIDRCEVLIDQTARIVLEKHGFSGEYSNLTITIVNQFDIGFLVQDGSRSREKPVSIWLRDLGLIGI